MKNCIAVFLFVLTINMFAQNVSLYENPPVFPACESGNSETLQSCFNREVYHVVSSNFKVPEYLTTNNFQGTVVVLFEINPSGEFKFIYADALYDDLKEEGRRVFGLMPKVKPATYNGKPIFKQYSVSIPIPLQEQFVDSGVQEVSALVDPVSNELDSISNSVKHRTKRQFNSTLNIPFSHSYYAKFDQNMNKLGVNAHTASKPLMYTDVSKYYDFETEYKALEKSKRTWLGRKFWNEHFVELEGKDYWFLFDPIADLQLGKDTQSDFGVTYNNTRGIVVQGGLGKHFTFSTSFYESQGRFPEYFNRYAESIAAWGSDPAIIPGRGIAKRYKTDAFDYPVADAFMSYSPAKFVNAQFGYGKNFIGDGYRSLLVSDVASPSPYLKVNVSFWKIKYTSTWLWLKDVRADVVEDKTYLSKYMANHYLSLNVSKRLNIGLFESVLWHNTNDRGFDVNYLNPLIFLRAIEFQTGQGAGNALIGFTAKYKLNNAMNLYGQFIIDEFSSSHVFGGEQSWKNKFGYQLGYKYYNAFNVDNLLLQAEYNQVRPYAYSHNTIILNYGHNNQSMAHLWGSNFRELVLIGRYNYQRWFADTKLIFGVRGLDFNTEADDYSYGGDIYRNYNERPYDTNVKIGQGIKTKTINAQLQAGYLINPSSNLKVFGQISYRNFNPEVTTVTTFENHTLWFNLGLRSDLFNWYFDL
ncbi:gliding motility protein RemB [Formosa sp. S-31]|uniref:gliding motility protein RemB n=1 Tax=Formosa sp. S-31 TaxID=2790949 RepID=UPI003EBB000B